MRGDVVCSITRKRRREVCRDSQSVSRGVPRIPRLTDSRHLHRLSYRRYDFGVASVKRRIASSSPAGGAHVLDGCSSWSRNSAYRITLPPSRPQREGAASATPVLERRRIGRDRGIGVRQEVLFRHRLRAGPPSTVTEDGRDVPNQGPESARREMA
jgi:hypothetical protein